MSFYKSRRVELVWKTAGGGGSHRHWRGSTFPAPRPPLLCTPRQGYKLTCTGEETVLQRSQGSYSDSLGWGRLSNSRVLSVWAALRSSSGEVCFPPPAGHPPAPESSSRIPPGWAQGHVAPRLTGVPLSKPIPTRPAASWPQLLRVPDEGPLGSPGAFTRPLGSTSWQARASGTAPAPKGKVPCGNVSPELLYWARTMESVKRSRVFVKRL